MIIDSLYFHKLELSLQQNIQKTDSIQNILLKHQISEDYFNHILNSQLTLFSIIVGLIATFSIATYVFVIRKYVKKKLKKINAELLIKETQIFRVSSWTYFSLYENYRKSNYYVGVFLNALHIVDIYLTRKVPVENMSIEDYINAWLKNTDFALTNIKKEEIDGFIVRDIENLFNNIDVNLKLEGNNVFSDLVLKIKIKYYSLINEQKATI